MRKWDLFKRGLGIPVIIIIALTLSGCPEEPPVEFVELPPPVGPEGGEVTGFEGDVVMTIPPGALSQQVRFSMHELLFKSGNEKDLLKTFVIEPYVAFNVPVNLRVKWNGCLSNGSLPCEGMDVFFCTWYNPTSYGLVSEGCLSTCCLDIQSESVSSCISGTGIIATLGNIR